MRKKTKQASLEEITQDPETYEAMRVPHESMEAVEDALRAFMADVKAARIKHRMCDVSVIIQPRYLDDGQVRKPIVATHYGSGLECLPMLAQAFGRERERYNQLIDIAAGGE